MVLRSKVGDGCSTPSELVRVQSCVSLVLITGNRNRVSKLLSIYWYIRYYYHYYDHAISSLSLALAKGSYHEKELPLWSQSF